MTFINADEIDEISENRPVFSVNLFVLDCVGYLIGSYLVAGVFYVIDDVSHTPTDFSHVFAILLAVCCSVANFLVAKRFGNQRWSGAKTLALSSMIGSVIYLTVSLLLAGLLHSFAEISTSFGTAIVAIPLIAIPVFVVSGIVRLISSPVIAVFETDDGPQQLLK